MDAKELVAALRAKHFNYAGSGKCGGCGTWDTPCIELIAADRIELVLLGIEEAEDYGTSLMLRTFARIVLNGEQL